MQTEITTQITPQLGARRRLTVFFRPILAFPALFLVSLIAPSSDGPGPLPIVIGLSLILFYSYPIWMIAFTHGILEFAVKTNAYLFLLTDTYPNFKSSLDFKVMLPDVMEGKAVNRWLPLIKWILAIPHYFIILIASSGVLAIALFNWFAILITGNYNGFGSKFTIGYLSYVNRVAGYAFAMVTDSYPRVITK